MEDEITSVGSQPPSRYLASGYPCWKRLEDSVKKQLASLKSLTWVLLGARNRRPTAHWLLKCESAAVFPDHKLWLLGSALQQ